MEAQGAAGYPWPPDMERRRVAALQRFHRSNPHYKVQQFMSEELQGTSRHRTRGEKRGLLSSANRLSLGAVEDSPKRFDNRWCLATTLELLAHMKAYVRAHKVRCIGEDVEKWKAIAIHLTNPRGLELKRLARSCMVRFDNLRRYFRVGWVAHMEAEIQDSLVDYFQVCEGQQPPVSNKRSQVRAPLKLSTVSIALNRYRRASWPSLQPTTATEKFHHRRTATYSDEKVCGGDDHAMYSADDLSGSSDDDAIGSSPAALGVHTQHRRTRKR